MKNITKTFAFGLILAVFITVLGNNPGMVAQTPQNKFEKQDSEYTLKQPRWKNQRFRICSLKAVESADHRVKFLVTYYIPPSYPETCYIAAYIPNKAHRNSHFTCIPAGMETIGVFKGQTSFSDNQWFQVQYTGPGTYTSRTIEVVLYDHKKTLQSKKMRWEKTWQGSGLPGPIVRESTRPGHRQQILGKTVKQARVSFELYGGFSTLNPEDLNLRADHEESVQLYYNDDYFNHETETGKISSWSKVVEGEFSKIKHALPLGLRIKYRLNHRTGA